MELIVPLQALAILVANKTIFLLFRFYNFYSSVE